MKLIVAGSRSFTDYRLLVDEILNLEYESDITEIVSGEARGADRMGAKWARQVEIPVKTFLPDWNQYGKSAGHIRNAHMADYADAAIVFWDGQSKGTQNMISQMERRGKPVTIITFTPSEDTA